MKGNEERDYIRKQRKSFGRFATFIAALTVPIAALWFVHTGHTLMWSIVVSTLGVVFMRGMVDLFYRKLIPIPTLFGTDDADLRDDDALQRRRVYWWGRRLRNIIFFVSLITFFWIVRDGTWTDQIAWMFNGLSMLTNPQVLMQLIILPIFFLANFLLFFGPMMMMGISQMASLEPGDADFGVHLDDVRGQKEAKEEIKKVVTLWQSGEHFASKGGKRERGVLFLGPPGTGKTMLAKAISTSFNSPIVMMPGSGFAQTFIGMDVIIVRYMARKARKLAAKWGGQCIVFIDEIDAVGMRRSALGGGAGGFSHPQVPGGGMGGMMGGMGQMGLQSLLVVMDGIDNPPFMRKTLTNKLNLWLDVSFIVPRKVSGVPLRLPRAKPTTNQIYFIGATNVPLESLDPALTRPGRMGRHIHFRTPTKRDRIDIFELYLGKVAHEDALDSERAREELARVTDGYSPAQIEQVCSLALSYAHHSEREAFSREDILEAMVTVEAGMALGWGYEDDEEERSTAIHEAGHAITSYLYEKGTEAVRLSVRKRGNTGGHLQSVETVERFAHYRSELVDRLTCILGAYAAEFVFYGHNTQGVGGDLQMASYLVGNMVGRWGMAPLPIDGDEKKLLAIGSTLLASAHPSDVPLSRGKMRSEALFLGQAFVIAYNAVEHNRMAIEKIADTLVQKKEIYGDDLTRLLDGCGLEAPEILWEQKATYPVLGTIPSTPRFEEEKA